MVSCYLIVVLHDFLQHDIIAPALKYLSILLWGNRIGSCCKEVCSDLSYFWVSDEQEPHSKAEKYFQHVITCFSLTIG